MDSSSSKPKKIMIQNKDTTLKMRINGRRTPIETKKAIIKIKENILKNCCWIKTHIIKNSKKARNGANVS